MNKVIEALKDKLEERQISTNQSVRELHGRDETYQKENLPDIVVFPKSTKDVVHGVNIAQKFKIPVTLWRGDKFRRSCHPLSTRNQFGFQ